MRFRPAVYRELLKPPSPPTEAQIRTEDLKQTFAEYGDLLKSNRAPANASLRLPLSNSQRQVNSSLDVASYLAVSPGTNRSTEPYRCDQDQGLAVFLQPAASSVPLSGIYMFDGGLLASGQQVVRRAALEPFDEDLLKPIRFP